MSIDDTYLEPSIGKVDRSIGEEDGFILGRNWVDVVPLSHHLGFLGGQLVLPDKFPELLHFLLMATRAKVPLLTTESDQVIVAAMITMQASEAATQIAAGLEGVQRLTDLRAEVSVPLLEPCLVVPLICLPVLRQALPQRGGPRTTRTVEGDGHRSMISVFSIGRQALRIPQFS